MLRGTGWVGGFADRRAEPGALLEPRRAIDRRRQPFTPAPTSVGSSPPRTQSWPSSILYSYSNRPARRRAGGARAVGVVDAAVARAHEEAGLGEPAHRAAEVRAVDGEHLERSRRRSAAPSTARSRSRRPTAARTGCGRSPAASGPRGSSRAGRAGPRPAARVGAPARTGSPTTGTANSAAATALSARPSVNRKLRRETAAAPWSNASAQPSCSPRIG